MIPRYSVLILGEDSCVEVYSPIRGLLGYAIMFSGGWDAWAVVCRTPYTMRQIATNLSSRESAVSLIGTHAA